MNSLLHKNNLAANPIMSHAKAMPFVQAKLTVNTPGDIYEQEADAMADRVMRMSSTETVKPVTGLIGKSLQRKCAHCEDEEKKKKPIMRKAEAGNSGMAVSTSFASSLNASKGGGSSLPHGTRSFMENAFSADFSSVKIHTDSQASEMTRGINAKAFTYGSDIYFNTGEYAPEKNQGKVLLAHELTHVIQQLSTGPIINRKECPATYTIPDNVYTAIDDAWNKSGHGGDTVTEQGGRIVTDATGKSVIRTGSGGGGSISLPAEQTGDTTVGTFHTHPYSKREGAEKIGVSFSGGDIENFVSGSQGGVKYIGAGSCDFVLNTVDTAARDTCKKEDLPKRWNNAFGIAGGTFQEKVETAVKATIAGCGLCYYRACRTDDKSAIPKDAKLA